MKTEKRIVELEVQIKFLAEQAKTFAYLLMNAIQHIKGMNDSQYLENIEVRLDEVVKRFDENELLRTKKKTG